MMDKMRSNTPTQAMRSNASRPARHPERMPESVMRKKIGHASRINGASRPAPRIVLASGSLMENSRTDIIRAMVVQVTTMRARILPAFGRSLCLYCARYLVLSGLGPYSREFPGR